MGSTIARVFKCCLGGLLLYLSLDSTMSDGGRAVSIGLLLVIWLSLLDDFAEQRHRDLIAKLEQIRLGDRLP